MAVADVRPVDRFTDEELAAFESKSAREILRWALETYGDDAAIGSSLQHTGMVQIDLAARLVDDFRVFTVDSLRMHDETYKFYTTVEEEYGIDLEIHQPDPDELESMIEEHGTYLFFDSREKQKLCCNIRKNRPHDRALRDVEVWICGLRRDQSENRRNTPKAQLVHEAGGTRLKLAPLADWTEADVWDYIEEHDVPYNPLFDRGYKTISCRICTTPVREDEDKRAGRWRWFKDHDRECGLHLEEGGGI